MGVFVMVKTFRKLRPKEVARRCSLKKVLLEISQNSQENYCARVSFLIKFQAWSLIKKMRLWHRFFPVDFVKLLRTLSNEKNTSYKTPTVVTSGKYMYTANDRIKIFRKKFFCVSEKIFQKSTIVYCNLFSFYSLFNFDIYYLTNLQ